MSHPFSFPSTSPATPLNASYSNAVFGATGGGSPRAPSGRRSRSSQDQRDSESKQKRVVEELFKTENDYVNYLKMLKRLYVEPARIKKLSAHEQHDDACATVKLFETKLTAIIETNSQFLAELEKIQESFAQQVLYRQNSGNDFHGHGHHRRRPSDHYRQPPPPQHPRPSQPAEVPLQTSVANLFMKYAKLFTIYAQYGKYSITYRNLVHFHRDHSTNFKSFLDNQMNTALWGTLNRQSFDSLLIMPMQRLPRYKLLLREMLNIDEGIGLTGTIDTLKSAIDEIEETTLHLNNALKDHEDQEKIRTIQAKFRGEVRITAPNRKWLREGNIVKLTKKGKGKPLMFHLFSDILVVSEASSNEFKFIQKFKLSEIKVVPTTRQTGSFELWSKEESFVVQCPGGETDADQWIQVIKKAQEAIFAIRRAQEAEGAAPREDIKWAKVFYLDKTHQACEICNTSFNMVGNRRHQCEQCASPVCANCSRKMTIPGVSDKPIRVCSKCDKAIAQEENDRRRDEFLKARQSSFKVSPASNSHSNSHSTSQSRHTVPPMTLSGMDIDVRLLPHGHSSPAGTPRAGLLRRGPSTPTTPSSGDESAQRLLEDESQAIEELEILFGHVAQPVFEHTSFMRRKGTFPQKLGHVEEAIKSLSIFFTCVETMRDLANRLHSNLQEIIDGKVMATGQHVDFLKIFREYHAQTENFVKYAEQLPVVTNFLLQPNVQTFLKSMHERPGMKGLSAFYYLDVPRKHFLTIMDRAVNFALFNCQKGPKHVNAALLTEIVNDLKTAMGAYQRAERNFLGRNSTLVNYFMTKWRPWPPLTDRQMAALPIKPVVASLTKVTEQSSFVHEGRLKVKLGNRHVGIEAPAHFHLFSNALVRSDIDMDGKTLHIRQCATLDNVSAELHEENSSMFVLTLPPESATKHNERRPPTRVSTGPEFGSPRKRSTDHNSVLDIVCASKQEAQRWVECIANEKGRYNEYSTLQTTSEHFDSIVAQVENVITEAERRRVKINEAVASLSSAMRGDVNARELRAAMKLARQVADEPAVANELPRAEDLLDRISKIESEMKKAILHVDHWALRQALHKAKRVHLTGETVTKASELSRAMEDMNGTLKFNRKRTNIPALKYYLAEADRLRLRSNEVKLARDFINAIDFYHRWADRAIADCDASALSSVVAEAKAKGVKTQKIERCRLLLQRIRLLEREELRAEDSLIGSHMTAVVHEAERIGWRSGVTDRLRSILAMPEAQRLDLQMSRALERGESARWRRICKHLKELFFEEHGRAYDIVNYPALKTPEEWARQKHDSSRSERHRLVDSFMCFQSSPIHSSLTNPPVGATGDSASAFQNNSKYMFRCIREYLGVTRKFKGDPMKKAHELISICCSSEVLRTECFCQLIKQTRANSKGPDCLHRTWDLLKLCVASFPPPSDFEEYLEFTLRDRSPDRRRYVALLHNALFAFGDQSGGEAGDGGDSSIAAPSVEQLRALLEDEDSATFSATPFEEDAGADDTWVELRVPYDHELEPHVEEALKTNGATQSDN